MMNKSARLLVLFLGVFLVVASGLGFAKDNTDEKLAIIEAKLEKLEQKLEAKILDKFGIEVDLEVVINYGVKPKEVPGDNEGIISLMGVHVIGGGW